MRSLDPIVFDVDLPAPLDMAAKMLLARAFVCHVMYMRGLVSVPLNHMDVSQSNEVMFEGLSSGGDDGTSSGGGGAKQKALARKRVRVQTAFAQLFNDLARVFVDTSGAVSVVSLMLGATSVHPKETYSMHFVSSRAHGTPPSPVPPSTPDKTVQACLRKLIRSMVMKWADVPVSTSKRLSIFVAVKPCSPPSLSSTAAASPVRANASFTCKPAFRVKAPKRGTAAVHILLQNSNGDGDGSGGINMGADSDTPAFWYVSKKGVKPMPGSA